jgi:hypothetical protein
MGLGMTQAGAKFEIKAENKEKALIALKRTINLISKMTGGTPDNKEFSSIDMEYINSRTLEEALECWNWGVENDSDGNIINISFLAEKVGDYKVMFNIIAPFVENGSYIHIWVEDTWRRPLSILQWWNFEDGKLKTKKFILNPDIVIKEHLEFIKQNHINLDDDNCLPPLQNPEIYKRIKEGILSGKYIKDSKGYLNISKE